MVRNGSTYPAGALTVNDAAGTLTSVAAYVVVSHGPDGSLANAVESGTVRADQHGSANQNENSDNDATFVQIPTNTIAGANYFDDIVAFKTAPNMIQACGPGACGNPE
jgi:hypothetical protein